MQKEYSNVILLSIDALRRDRVNGDYERDVAPFLSRLARENTEFTNCISTSSHTREAMSSMLTGLYPFKANRKGFIPENAPGAGFHLDAETVSSYIEVKTGGFHSNPFLSRSFGYGRDWDRFDDDLYLGNSKILTLLNRFIEKLANKHYSKASKINKKSLKWVSSLEGEDFFLWNHYMDPHGPYQPPEKFKGRYQDNPVSDRGAQKLLKKAMDHPEKVSEKERQRLVNLYDEEISYVDSEVEKLFDDLENRGLLEDSLVIIVGDHGEAFGENGFYEHGGALTEELVRVPMILVDGKDRTVDSPVSVIDTLPTVLSVLGGPANSDLDGQNLVDIAEDPEKFSGRAVFFQETKNQNLIFGGFDGEEFYITGIDDKEEIRTGEGTGLGKEVENYARKVLDGKVNTEDDEVEEEVKERLEALGYMEDKSR